MPQLSEGAGWLRLSTEVLSRNVPSVSKPGLLKAMTARLSVYFKIPNREEPYKGYSWVEDIS
jgi:hypothetical protein